ncbi:Carbohydrate esterase [Dyadobacter sp. CECT 9275]|uniref:Carbohydrate esterase n=1 Tax=Dyadobacter helix TaxID=2822344 RepID=A0A916J8Q1_9BACT|nr:acetylxylan esterase [Dyadobacter sp. CECT 9275]CAG4988436.1 Carbohydrate esterase [Dyadobacter sp. CECT 9275]
MMKFAAVLLTFNLVTQPLFSQKTIRDESQVVSYVLPDLLKTRSGKMVRTKRDWEKTRRPELLSLFSENVYGKTPSEKVPMRFVQYDADSNALGGQAIRKQVTVYFGKKGERSMDILLYFPRNVKGSVPVFLGLNFAGNQVVHQDPGITITKRWVRDGVAPVIVEHRATEASRGSQAGDWVVEDILARGYGLATVFCGDLQPDRPDSFNEGVHSLFFKEGQNMPQSDEWGAIGAWAWGLSRAMDYLETDKMVDATKVAVIGHSRLGKAALWAGAQDQRFAMVVSNNSGEGGAAITRRKFGETIEIINKAFPHWFSGNYKQFGGREDALPVDYHELIALIAPRPVYIASASEDWWADPKGEYLSGYYASPAYALYGSEGLSTPELPETNRPTGAGKIGYHLRKGGHTMNRYDWQQYLHFADKWLRR